MTRQKVIETMMREKRSCVEAARQYEISGHERVRQWERIYLEEGPEGLYIERRGRGSKGGPPKQLKPVAEEDLLAEVQRLRAENDYIKKEMSWLLRGYSKKKAKVIWELWHEMPELRVSENSISEGNLTDDSTRLLCLGMRLSGLSVSGLYLPLAGFPFPCGKNSHPERTREKDGSRGHAPSAVPVPANNESYEDRSPHKEELT